MSETGRTKDRDISTVQVGVYLRSGSTSLKRALFAGGAGLVIAALSALWFAHRIPEPPRVTLRQAAAALEKARETLEAAAGVRSDPEHAPPGGTGPGPRVSTPVFITLYPPGRSPTAEPVWGSWWPSLEQPSLPLREAVAFATEAAAARLGQAGRDKARSRPIKLDVAGSFRRLWSEDGDYLFWILDPGRDGLSLGDGSTRRPEALMLPSWPIERDLKLPHWVRWLRGRNGGDLSGGILLRFRTTAYLSDPAVSPEVQPLFRGNVLGVAPTPEVLAHRIRLGGDYLRRAVMADGRYCYSYSPITDRCGRDYNLLRHAGTTYSLYQVHRALQGGEEAVRTGDEQRLEAAERAIGWLRLQVRPVADDLTRCFLLEGNRAKLGAVGLTLLAMVEREKLLKDGEDRATMKCLAAFVISQQRADGFLESYFAWSPSVAVPWERSIYYPGEAVLGLTRLHDLEPRSETLKAALLSANFLAHRRWTWGGIELTVPPDAWLTQALSELYLKSGDRGLRDYAYRVTAGTARDMLRQQEGAAPDLAGGPAAGPVLPSVTPAASRNEGLTAAWRMAAADADRELQSWLLDLATASAVFQLQQQFHPANSYFLARPERALGGFRERPDSQEIRIDYVQHNLTGLIGLYRILTGASP